MYTAASLFLIIFCVACSPVEEASPREKVNEIRQGFVNDIGDEGLEKALENLSQECEKLEGYGFSVKTLNRTRGVYKIKITGPNVATQVIFQTSESVDEQSSAERLDAPTLKGFEAPILQ